MRSSLVSQVLRSLHDGFSYPDICGHRFLNSFWVAVGGPLVQCHCQAERATYIAVMLFFLTAVIGVGHDFYWIAKPMGVIAFGSVFSTTQVFPLILLTFDAWKPMQMTELAEEGILPLPRHLPHRQSCPRRYVWCQGERCIGQHPLLLAAFGGNQHWSQVL